MKENKTKRKLISLILLIITLLTNILPIFQYTVFADSATIAYGGPISYGASTVGKFWINGNVAFCVDHKKATPPGGTYVESEIYHDDNILKCLYYGWGGKEQYGFASEAQGIVYTTLALDHFKNGNANKTAQPFIDYVNSKPVPQVILDFSANYLDAYKEGDIQRTNAIQVTGNSDFCITIPLPANVTLVNETKGTRHTGSANVYGGDYFHIEAPLSVTGAWRSNAINNHKYNYQPILFKTSIETYQKLASGYKVIVDPNSSIYLNINFMKTGALELHKTDKETGKAIANTTFEVRNADDSVITTVTTDNNGYAKVDNLIIGTYKLVEKKANDKYLLNNSPITVQVETGQTATVNITNDHKTGSLKIVKVDSRDNKTPIKGVTFEIWNTELNKKIATKTTDEKGEIFIDNLRTGNYAVHEISTNEWYNLDTSEKTVLVEWNKTAVLNVKNDVKTGFIEIIKQDDTFTDEKLANVTFEIRNSKNELVDTLVTDNRGYAKSKELPIDDTYIVKETKTDKDYVLLPTTLSVSFQSSENGVTKNLTIGNKRKTGHLKVYKIDADNNKVVLGNVAFDLFSYEQNKVIGTYRTDVNGEIFIENLRVGEYKLIERETNNQYNLAEDMEIVIKADTVNEVVIQNELKKGKVKVIKVDKDNNEIKLKDVVFEVQDENGKTLEIIKTDENGEAQTKDYAVRDFEKLRLYEISTNKYYKLKEDVTEVELKANETVPVTIENEIKKGKIKVIKVDKDNNEIKLANVEFNVLDEKGNIVDTLKTDINGEAVTKDLPLGHTYKLQETKTLETYELNKETITITLEEEKITDVIVENEAKKGQIRVVKVDKDNNEIRLEGIEFNVLDEEGNIVDKLVTDKNGEAVSKRLPINHTYRLQETKTLDIYVLNEEMQTVTLKEDEISNLQFENEKIKGTLTIEKVDKSDKGKKLENVEFGIYNEDGELIEIIKTDKEGKATTSLLPLGTYYAQELDTGSPYYLLNPDTFEFEITKENLDPEMTVEDEPTDITVDVDKTGDTEVKPNDIVNYTFDNIANTSNTYLDKFEWYDYIPTDSVRLLKMESGTYNQELNYNVYYKTNKTNEYILFKNNLSTQENYDLDFTEISFAEDEFITEVFFDFGKVDIGFRNVVTPTMQCKTLPTLQDGDTFTNETKTVGFYYDIKTETHTKWTTVVEIPKEPKEPTLPRTGR